MKTMYGAQTLTLPSGNKVRVRRPSVLSLIAAGGFPNELTNEAWKLARKEMIDPEKLQSDPQGIQLWAALIGAFVPHVCLDLKVVQAAVGGTKVDVVDGLMTGVIEGNDLSDMDKQVIFLFGTDVLPSDEEQAEARREVSAESLKEFRDGGQGADAGHGGEEVRAEAVVDAGPA